MTVDEERAFLWNSKNEFNCADCPYAYDGKYRSCGQQQCWVTAHTLYRQRQEAEYDY